MRLHDLGMIFTLSCDEASRLISESLDRPLRRSERVALRVHTAICRACRIARRQIIMLHDLAGRMPDSAREQLGHTIPRLSAERKQQIKQLLAQARRTS